MFESVKLKKAMESLKKGDKSFFDVVYDQTFKLVYQVIYGIIKDPEKTNDLVQETYMKVLEKIHLYKENNSPKAWICMIARNIAINKYNQDKRCINIDIEDLNKVDNTKEKTIDTPIMDLALKILDPEEYQIVMLLVVNNMTRKECAEIFNLSISGVTWKLNNALKKLKKALEEGDENEIK